MTDVKNTTLKLLTRDINIVKRKISKLLKEDEEEIFYEEDPAKIVAKCAALKWKIDGQIINSIRITDAIFQFGKWFMEYPDTWSGWKFQMPSTELVKTVIENDLKKNFVEVESHQEDVYLLSLETGKFVKK